MQTFLDMQITPSIPFILFPADGEMNYTRLVKQQGCRRLCEALEMEPVCESVQSSFVLRCALPIHMGWANSKRLWSYCGMRRLATHWHWAPFDVTFSTFAIYHKHFI